MNDKRGLAIGSATITLFRVLVVSIIAFIIFGLSAVFYTHHISVRSAEAQLMTRQLIDCVAPKGVLEISLFTEEVREDIFTYCNTGGKGKDKERFYVLVKAKNSTGDTVLFVEVGDSGSVWAKDIYGGSRLDTSRIKKHVPGYFSTGPHPIRIFSSGSMTKGTIFVEVLINDEI